MSCKHEFEEGYVGKVGLVCKKCHTLKSELYALELLKERDELREQVADLKKRNAEWEGNYFSLKSWTDWVIWALGEIRGPMCCGTCANLVLPFCFTQMHCSKDGKKCNNDDWCKEWRPKGWREVFAKDALAMTPPEAAERVNVLLRALEFYAIKYTSEWHKSANDDFGEKAREALAEWKGEKP